MLQGRETGDRRGRNDLEKMKTRAQVNDTNPALSTLPLPSQVVTNSLRVEKSLKLKSVTLALLCKEKD